MIKVNKVSKSFGENLILDNISFNIDDGEFIAIMGSSGSGKSTLLYAISGMDKIDEGEIELLQKNLLILSEQELEEFRLSKMGFVFQKPYLFKNLSVIDNIMYPGLALKKISEKELEVRAMLLLKNLGIEELAYRDTRKLSGGQYQRVAIARALINEPRILFADEPTGALNSKISKEVMEIFKQINEGGVGVVMVTHDISSAASANRVIFLKDGKIIEEIKNSSNYPNNISSIGKLMERLEI